MKMAYRNQRIGTKRMAVIEVCNEILDEHIARGYRLTLRQLYYQLVTENIIANKTQEYQKLGATMVVARMNGLVDWEVIEDRIRQPYLPYYVNSIKEVPQDTISYYRLNRQENQPYHMEIWAEKGAVSTILSKVSSHYHIRLMINRGYSSCSAMRKSSKRLCDGRSVKILYVGDHDPSGLDMLRDIEDRLEEFELENFEVIPVALTMEQVKQYKPPENPTKINDPRAIWYMQNYGQASWELSALKPWDLELIVSDAVEEFLDRQQFHKMIRREKRDITKLKTLMKDW